MKWITLLITVLALCSALALVSCDAPELILSLSPATASNTVGDWCELTATITRDGTPVSGAEISFEFTPDSVHHPANLTSTDSFDIEWVEEWPPEGSFIAEHWKKEKVYRSSSNMILCPTGPAGQAIFRYNGIYEGEDTIVVSATVDGSELTAEATVTWILPAVTISLSPATASNTVGDWCELTATITRDGTPVSGAEISFEFTPDSVHHPANLTSTDSFDIEWVEEWPPEGSFIAEHWKKEKVYRSSSDMFLCATGPAGQAIFRYSGIYEGEDTIVASATVDGTYVEATATITWEGPATPFMAPILISPSNGSSVSSLNVPLSWDAVPGALDYEVQVDTSPDFLSGLPGGETISYIPGGTTATLNLISGFSNNTIFYWRVRAVDESGTSPWSEVWSFLAL